MRLLVTGGGGFIGSHLTERLVEAGHDVVVVDRQPATIVPGARLVQAEIADAGSTRACVEGVEAVFHLAARVGLGLDFSDAPGYVADNDLATSVLLAALTAAGFAGRLVLSSSMVVYGEGGYRCPDHGVVRPGVRSTEAMAAGRFEPPCPRCGADLRWEPVGEQAPLGPRSVYAATKVAQEHLCSAWAAETGASVAALRYHNVYGRRLPLGTPYAGVAALFRDRLRAGQPPLVFEDGGQTRDFVHVDDVAAANIAALAAPIAAGALEAFNVASGRPVTILEVARLLCSAFGPSAPEPVVTGRFRAGDVRHVVASPERARAELGFSASTDLAWGLTNLAAEPLP